MTPPARLRALTPGNGNRVVVAFPFAGAGPHAYAEWPRHMPPDVDLVVVDLPGRATRLRESPVDDLESLVDDLAGQIAPLLPRGVTVFGHSAGASMAWATVDELWRRGVNIHRLVVSGAVNPHAREQPRLDTLPRSELIDMLRVAGGTPAGILESDELMDLSLPAIRSDLSLAWQASDRTPGGMNVPVSAIGGTSDPRVPTSALEGWRKYTRGPAEVRVLPGGHFFFNEDLAGFLQVLTLLAR